MKGTLMSDLSAAARERAALATVADAIVAASVGRGLRVAVVCPTSHLDVVDHLAQALHARGRACRCLPVDPEREDDVGVPADRHQTGPAVVVITSGLAAESDRAVHRVNITVTAGLPVARAGELDRQKRAEAPSAARGEADIILDYREAAGPRIRYMSPHLTAGDWR
ncbi:hypothetical protein Q2K19_01285 [Micromonospora soli]|uniref:hypothetical protein n=1 Tax=Micromonospora sp. NBRC 110009 TaxID=3061627 RepID=UPI0026713352|nr:hypothetical protein [Micromonospora sp. NBRC 110009]WKT99179.1 hypothetical protein Q2K19_01285 [Micromonospora sp. NBRC 110009]